MKKTILGVLLLMLCTNIKAQQDNEVNTRFKIKDNTSSIELGQWDGSRNRIESVGRKLFLTSYTGGISFGNSGTEQIVMNNAGYFGIGVTNPDTQLHIRAAELGAISNDRSILAKFEGNVVGNFSKFQILNKRNTNGTTWFNTSVRLQRVVDATPQGFIDFGIEDKTSNNGLAFGTRNGYAGTQQTRMVIGDNGNVGIGTTSPGAKLQISGEDSDRIILSNKTVNFNLNSPKLSLFGYSNGTQITGPSLQKINIGGYGRGRLAIFQHGGADYTSEEEVMSILPNGYVGIGTIDPSSKLTVGGDLRIGEGNVYKDVVLKTGAAITGYNGVFEIAPKTIPGSGIAQHVTYFKNAAQPNGKTVHSLVVDGNVGIGTTDTKGFKLGVNGKIATTEVKVATYANWADFVFEKEYNLQTLNEVEKHIKEKGHLKDIPSAAEVKKEGFFLGEMDAKLLQKIEELTLYTIQQEKKIKAQEEKMNLQDKKIKKQEGELKSLKDLSNRLSKIEARLNTK
ncbi:hypothetical protein [uncultured Tenacibaculum sp.]|uniref:hypothetical protein n=1 Tax=uncultured Tenacibaculum sp. TaxID=174713 RepID=UPI00263427C8|nr:hypothetical protein [uncultured Tenacibaculum sp.]